MTKHKRRDGVGARGWWWVAGLLAVGGCKTAGTPAPEEANGGVNVCPTNNSIARENLTIQVGCEGLKTGSVNSCAFQQATVIFQSQCDRGPVKVQWTDPETLFTNDTSGLFILQNEGDTWKGEVGAQPGPHVLCVDTERCPPGGTIESKTGSLDVYTTGNYPREK
ncbi:MULTISPECIES: hypothetical protein [Corallococcus]|uniref:hypothetical protein n=1 Tax=Corallococcus TaxID=83461 RepID=UPI00117D7385|nr:MULTISPECIES: hypothetical protein [Corallococcus]NBD12292.1 hypothetical protein [Corallococcus silvisoli]TSC25244.1 hypothetical protein FOF48_25275 [Corallococcus sp. Z5C101001]